MTEQIHVSHDEHLEAMAASILQHCQEKQWKLATAESLTGGMVSARICDVPGASDVFLGGIVSYSSDIKRDILRVDKDRLADNGAVDHIVCVQMAEGVCNLFEADIAVATTGVAGPDPQDGHDVGEVHIAVATPEGSTHRRFEFQGDRQSIRSQTVDRALAMLLRVLTGND